MSSFQTWRFTVTLAVIAAFGAVGVVCWALSGMNDLTPQQRAPSALLSSPVAHEQPQQPRSAYEGTVNHNTDHDWLTAGTLSPQASTDEFDPLWLSRPLFPLTAVPPRTPEQPPGQMKERQEPPPVSKTRAPRGLSRLTARSPQGKTSAAAQARADRRPPLDPKPDRAHAAVSKPADRQAGHLGYVEKYVRQGDAGAVEFHDRRQDCAPPNMVDVCPMPPESRPNIVAQP